MIVLIGVLALVVGMVLYAYDSYSDLPFFFLFSGCCWLAILAVTVPTARMGDRAEIAEFNAVRATVEAARKNGIDPLELAAFQQTVADANKWLAEKQYWRGTVFGIWFAPQVEKMSPIQ